MKKILKTMMCMALSIAMLLGIVSAATMNNIPVIKDGELTKVTAERLGVKSDYAQDDNVMTEEQLTFSIPKVKKTQYSLYSREEKVGNTTIKTYRAATADGTDIENVKLDNGDYKYYVVNKTFGTALTEADQLMAGGTATVAERDENGDLILETTADGKPVMSADKGVLTAQTYWNGYLFTVWSFIGTQNADYHTNLVIYDLDTLEIVASYNLKDLGIQYDWYHDGIGNINGYDKTTVAVQNANNWSLPAITGIYVDDDYLFIKGLGKTLVDNANKFLGHRNGGYMWTKLYCNPVKKSGVNEIGTLKLGSNTWGDKQITEFDSTGVTGGLRMVLEYGADVVRIGNYIVDAYPLAGRYRVYEVSDSSIKLAGDKKSSDLKTLLGATSLTMYDVDYEGSDMYITYNDGSNLKVAKVDITDPLNPLFKWASTVNKTISYTDGGKTETTKAFAYPELEISGDIAVMYDKINTNGASNRDGNPTKLWVAVLDMSNKNDGVTELLWYDNKGINVASAYSPAVMYSVICDDYILTIDRRYNHGNVGVALAKLNADKTSIEIADYMKLTDNGSGEMINGMFTYEGKVFVSYMDNSASTGKAGRISVLTPFKEEPEFPTDITADTDAENAEWILEEGDSITIADGVKLSNATIDATNGKVVMGTTEITGGTVIFNDKGEIDVADKSSIKLVQSVYNISWEENGETKNANSDNGTEAVGFMTRTDFEEGAAATKYIMNIEAIHNGTTKNGTVEIPTPGIYSGSVRLLFSFVNVPKNAVVNVTGGQFE